MSPYRGSHLTLRPPSQQPLSIGSTGGERAELRLERSHEVGAAALREALVDRQRLAHEPAAFLLVAAAQREHAQARERRGDLARVARGPAERERLLEPAPAGLELARRAREVAERGERDPRAEVVLEVAEQRQGLLEGGVRDRPVAVGAPRRGDVAQRVGGRGGAAHGAEQAVGVLNVAAQPAAAPAWDDDRRDLHRPEQGPGVLADAVQALQRVLEQLARRRVLPAAAGEQTLRVADRHAARVIAE